MNIQRLVLTFALLVAWSLLPATGCESGRGEKGESGEREEGESGEREEGESVERSEKPGAEAKPGSAPADEGAARADEKASPRPDGVDEETSERLGWVLGGYGAMVSVDTSATAALLDEMRVDWRGTPTEVVAGVFVDTLPEGLAALWATPPKGAAVATSIWIGLAPPIVVEGLAPHRSARHDVVRIAWAAEDTEALTRSLVTRLDGETSPSDACDDCTWVEGGGRIALLEARDREVRMTLALLGCRPDDRETLRGDLAERHVHSSPVRWTPALASLVNASDIENTGPIAFYAPIEPLRDLLRWRDTRHLAEAMTEVPVEKRNHMLLFALSLVWRAEGFAGTASDDIEDALVLAPSKDGALRLISTLTTAGRRNWDALDDDPVTPPTWSGSEIGSDIAFIGNVQAAVARATPEPPVSVEARLRSVAEIGPAAWMAAWSNPFGLASTVAAGPLDAAGLTSLRAIRIVEVEDGSRGTSTAVAAIFADDPASGQEALESALDALVPRDGPSIVPIDDVDGGLAIRFDAATDGAFEPASETLATGLHIKVRSTNDRDPEFAARVVRSGDVLVADVGLGSLPDPSDSVELPGFEPASGSPAVPACAALMSRKLGNALGGIEKGRAVRARLEKDIEDVEAVRASCQLSADIRARFDARLGLLRSLKDNRDVQAALSDLCEAGELAACPHWRRPALTSESTESVPSLDGLDEIDETDFDEIDVAGSSARFGAIIQLDQEGVTVDGERVCEGGLEPDEKGMLECLVPHVEPLLRAGGERVAFVADADTPWERIAQLWPTLARIDASDLDVEVIGRRDGELAAARFPMMPVPPLRPSSDDTDAAKRDEDAAPRACGARPISGLESMLADRRLVAVVSGGAYCPAAIVVADDGLVLLDQRAEARATLETDDFDAAARTAAAWWHWYVGVSEGEDLRPPTHAGGEPFDELFEPDAASLERCQRALVVTDPDLRWEDALRLVLRVRALDPAQARRAGDSHLAPILVSASVVARENRAASRGLGGPPMPGPPPPRLVLDPANAPPLEELEEEEPDRTESVDVKED